LIRIDEIKLRARVSSALSEAAVAGRLKDAAAQLGETLASCLMERVL